MLKYNDDNRLSQKLNLINSKPKIAKDDIPAPNKKIKLNEGNSAFAGQ